MRKYLVATTAAVALAAVAAGALNAQAGPPAQAMDTGVVTSGTYTVDPNHSMIGWSLSHFGFNDYFGIFGNVSGTLDLDVDDISSSSVDISIPIAEVTVPSAGLRDHLLRPGADGGAPDFFGPDPEPARFVSTMVHQIGNNRAHIMGNLTFNGQTHPVTIEAGLSGLGTNRMNRKETIGFHGTATIQRSQWGIGYGTQMGLGDEVTLHITAAFEK